MTALLVGVVASIVSCAHAPPADMEATASVDNAARLLLFDENGAEREHPSSEAFLLLYRADAKQQEALIDGLLQILAKGKGYSRVVVARELLFYFSDPKYAPLLTKERALCLAANVVELAPEVIGPVTDHGVLAGYPPELRRRIAPRVRVHVDDRDIPLGASLPAGWRPIKGLITVDGKVAYDCPVYVGSGAEGEIRQDTLLEILGNHSVGEHVIRSSLVFRTLNGAEIPVSNELRIRIYTRNELNTPAR